MSGFLKTFGKGILYFLASPFAILFLLIYGIFLFFVNIGTFFRLIKEKTSKKKTKIQELDEKALIIMKANKYSDNNTNNISENHITNNNIVITNKEDLVNLINSINNQNKIEETKKIEDTSSLITNVEENSIIKEDSNYVRGENIKRIK